MSRSSREKFKNYVDGQAGMEYSRPAERRMAKKHKAKLRRREGRESIRHMLADDYADTFQEMLEMQEDWEFKANQWDDLEFENDSNNWNKYNGYDYGWGDIFDYGRDDFYDYDHDYNRYSKRSADMKTITIREATPEEMKDGCRKHPTMVVQFGDGVLTFVSGTSKKDAFISVGSMLIAHAKEIVNHD